MLERLFKQILLFFIEKKHDDTEPIWAREEFDTAIDKNSILSEAEEIRLELEELKQKLRKQEILTRQAESALYNVKEEQKSLEDKKRSLEKTIHNLRFSMQRAGESHNSMLEKLEAERRHIQSSLDDFSKTSTYDWNYIERFFNWCRYTTHSFNIEVADIDTPFISSANLKNWNTSFTVETIYIESKNGGVVVTYVGEGRIIYTFPAKGLTLSRGRDDFLLLGSKVVEMIKSHMKIN